MLLASITVLNLRCYIVYYNNITNRKLVCIHCSQTLPFPSFKLCPHEYYARKIEGEGDPGTELRPIECLLNHGQK